MLYAKSLVIQSRSKILAYFQLHKMEAILKFFRIFLFYISTSLVILQVKSPVLLRKEERVC